MISVLLAAVIAQADEGLDRVADRMGESVQQLNQAAGREAAGRLRLKSMDKSIEEQTAILKLLDELIEKASTCPQCKKGG